MKYKVGIFGSSENETESMRVRAQALGKILAPKDIILITGACSGLPYQVVSVAHQTNKKIEIWGYSPEYDYKGQVKGTPEDDNTIYSRLFYIPRDYPLTDIMARRKYRNISSTFACDVGIIVSGRWGTMNEFTNLHDMGKVIGVLTGTGGISDELQDLNNRIKKKSNAMIFYKSDPQKLVDMVLGEVTKRRTV